MADPFLGEIRLFGFNFPPNGWAICAGQLLPINQNTALFSLLGTQYGGDGRTNFALPDLRGRVAMSFGQGPGLTNRNQGEVSGEENHQLLQGEMPSHTHQLSVGSAEGTAQTPVNNFLAAGPTAGGTQFVASNPDASMHPNAIAIAGNSFPHNNLQPYLVLNYCISLIGIFPSRN